MLTAHCPKAPKTTSVSHRARLAAPAVEGPAGPRKGHLARGCVPKEGGLAGTPGEPVSPEREPTAVPGQLCPEEG